MLCQEDIYSNKEYNALQPEKKRGSQSQETFANHPQKRLVNDYSLPAPPTSCCRWRCVWLPW